MAGDTSFVLHVKGDMKEGVVSRVVLCLGMGGGVLHGNTWSVLRFYCQTPKQP